MSEAHLLDPITTGAHLVQTGEELLPPKPGVVELVGFQ